MTVNCIYIFNECQDLGFRTGINISWQINLIFSTIFIDNWLAKILGNNWPWFIPMHLSYFNQNNIDAPKDVFYFAEDAEQDLIAARADFLPDLDFESTYKYKYNVAEVQP